MEALDQRGKIDLGAAWINDTTQHKMYALANKYRFDLVQQRTEGKSIFELEDGTSVIHCCKEPPPVCGVPDIDLKFHGF